MFVVASHVYRFGFNGDDFVSIFIRNIVTGWTGVFVFVSGFMFHYYFLKNFSYIKFLRDKLINIGFPYIFLATLGIAILFFADIGYFSPVETMPRADFFYQYGVLFDATDPNWLVILKYYATGRFLMAYWYIPFVALLFSMAPLHVRFVRLSARKQLLIISALSILAILVQRPVEDTNPLQSLVYFTPAYLIGIFVSLHNQKVKEILDGKLLLLLFCVLSMSLAQYLSGHRGNYHKPFFEYGTFDFMYVQKLFLMLFLYMLFENYVFKSKIIDIVSRTSFAIYFIHPWVHLIFSELGRGLKLFPDSGNNIFLYILTCISMLLISMRIATLIKIFSKGSKKTRYFIGY